MINQPHTVAVDFDGTIYAGPWTHADEITLLADGNGRGGLLTAEGLHALFLSFRHDFRIRQI